MPTFGPVSRRTLIQSFRRLEFAGPYSGGKHQFMVRGTVTVRIPNPIKATSVKNCWRESSVKPV